MKKAYRESHEGVPTLSVCIITLNNAHCLEKALQSVEEAADEIVVLDGGSTDGTRAVASSRAKVKLFEHAWPDNFALQKNYCMDKASGDWILLLDSDEMIGLNLRKKIRKLIGSPRHLSYIFPRYWLIQQDPLRYVHSRKLYPDYQQRLFRNLPDFRYQEQRRVHEKFNDCVHGVGKKIKDCHIFHFDFIYNDRETRREKARRRNVLAPETAHINRNQYMFEEAPYPYKFRKCREKLW